MSYDFEYIGREKSYEEFVDYIMNDVSEEKIEDLFYEMGIDIDLNKPWKNMDE